MIIKNEPSDSEKDKIKRINNMLESIMTNYSIEERKCQYERN
jgi:hypothetical protein